MLLYFVFVLGIGFALKRYMKTSKDFFQAGRALPAWICGLAFISANLGAQEVIGMGASGAKYGLETAHFYGIGAIPAMIFVGIFMMPFYYGSKARSVPEFLRLRFDEKTRALNACSFAVMTVFSSGISMYAMARLIQALHVFDGLFQHAGLAAGGDLHLFHRAFGNHCAALHFSRRAHQRDLQRGAAVLPHHCGFSAAGAAGPEEHRRLERAERPRCRSAYMHEWKGVMHASTNPMGIEIIGIGMGLGFVLGLRLLVHGLPGDPDGDGFKEHGVGAACAADCRGSEDVFSVSGDSAGTARDRAAHAAHHHGCARTTTA